MGIRDECTFENETFNELVIGASNGMDGIAQIRTKHLRNRESVAKSMWLVSHSAATDLHDKVYSFLVLMPGNAKELITPGYNESIVETFTKATYAAIALDGKLDLLGWVKLPGDGITSLDQRPKRNPDLLSWVVDLTDVDYGLFDIRVRDFMLNFWVKTRTSPKQARYLNNGRLLVIGYSLDCIKYTKQFEQKGWAPTKEEQAAVCEFLAQATNLASQNNPKELFVLKSKEKKIIQPQITWTEWYSQIKRQEEMEPALF
ncbi:hypothetical protein G7Y89_g1530 [Cudoniella acicularis]|uniref:Uncharacterized protein n=1 Tax=Cudoniella acicularis TaxID=354080 RepID=A0A8H4RWV6_9HELO|nr:hypothetical protein G7Y89_g1530 [Cudoniella acicularis]